MRIIELHANRIVTSGEGSYEAQRIIKLIQVSPRGADELHLKFNNGSENDLLVILQEIDTVKINGRVISEYLSDRFHTINNFYYLN